MRGKREIQRFNFGARPEYHYSPSKRDQRRNKPRAPPDHPHTHESQPFPNLEQTC